MKRLSTFKKNKVHFKPLLGNEKKIRRENKVRERVRREKKGRNRVDLRGCLV
jgi:hypothetical protein